MAGPFPGMDPYIELQAAWPDFHNALIAEIRNQLGASLPEGYIARVDERIEVANRSQQSPDSSHKDVLVKRFDKIIKNPEAASSKTPAATLEPRLIEILDRDPDEHKITWVEIRSIPDLELVTTVEVLSPINKYGQGRRAYLEKRDRLHESRVNLVEIDLLLEGSPLPMKERIEPGVYYAVVARGERLPTAEVYVWTVRDPLPRLPIPLREPDPDVLIDLSDAATRVYESGRYARTLRYVTQLPETTTLNPDDRAWVESHVRRISERQES